jgi:XisI protein
VDKLNCYRAIAKKVIEEYAAFFKPDNGEVTSEVVVDSDHDHYELMQIGFENLARVHDCIIHLDIIDGKIWVQHDATNRPVVDELLAAGIPAQDIVRGFHPAKLRHHTEFAVG